VNSMAPRINRLESMWPQSESSEVAAGRESAFWSNKAKHVENNLESLLRKHPRVAIAAAAAVGIALGWIVKRK
jgi:ElaB/YqjD/DUF883 family membrane-anchored ribosome-binding protein